MILTTKDFSSCLVPHSSSHFLTIFWLLKDILPQKENMLTRWHKFLVTSALFFLIVN